MTLYTADGKVVGLYYGSSGASTDAVVVSGTATEAMFHQLTGGASNYTIEKNGQTITMADIQPYDVVTYDSVANKLIVSRPAAAASTRAPSPTPERPRRSRCWDTSLPSWRAPWNPSRALTWARR